MQLYIVDVTEIIYANSPKSDDIIAPVSKRRRVIESKSNSKINDEKDSLEWTDVTEPEKISDWK